jgi:hypothetical protein
LIDGEKINVPEVSCNFFVINVSKGSKFSRIFILHNSRCQVLCGSCKKIAIFTSLLLYFFGPSRSLVTAILSVEIWVPFKPVLGDVRNVAHFNYLSCKDSIKPSLQFSFNFVVINASEGSPFYKMFLIVSNLRAEYSIV